MKKLTANKKGFTGAELLSRAELKKVLGGTGGGGGTPPGSACTDDNRNAIPGTICIASDCEKAGLIDWAAVPGVHCDLGNYCCQTEIGI